MRTAYTERGTRYKAKQGVEVGGSVPQLDILEVASEVYEDTPQDLVVTSGDEGHPGDGVHSSGSLHYPANTPEGAGGRALDLRIWNLPDPASTADELASRLGQKYDVVYGPDHDTHIHIEYDP